MSDQLKIEEYSDKAFVVRGNSKPYKEQFTSRYGKWNSNLKGGSGWIFSNKHKEKITLFVNDINKKTKLPTKKRKYIENIQFYNKKFRKQILDELDERFRLEYEIKKNKCQSNIKNEEFIVNYQLINSTKPSICSKLKSNTIFKFILICIFVTIFTSSVLICFPTETNIYLLEYTNKYEYIYKHINDTLYNIYYYLLLL